jgi:hypothetical protein
MAQIPQMQILVFPHLFNLRHLRISLWIALFRVPSGVVPAGSGLLEMKVGIMS